MKTACYFKISWSGRPEQTVTIMVFNAKRALNDSFTLPAWEHKAFQRGLLQADPHGFSETARAGLCALQGGGAHDPGGVRPTRGGRVPLLSVLGANPQGCRIEQGAGGRPQRP
ncbi:MAG: hypothetical protein VX420_04170 [SAR324 cluster bacterium]|nr:hypothetical protein [SAR324 cluster bacterium]